MTPAFALPPFTPPPGAVQLRAEIRDFLTRHPPPADPVRRANCWSVADAGFSRALGAAGWLGMVWPRAYGGRERPAMERLAEVLRSTFSGLVVHASTSEYDPLRYA